MTSHDLGEQFCASPVTINTSSEFLEPTRKTIGNLPPRNCTLKDLLRELATPLSSPPFGRSHLFDYNGGI